MKKLPLLLSGVVLALNACTVSSALSPRAEVSAPLLMPSEWEAATYQSQDGAANFCSISSGYNGIEVIMKKTSSEALSAVVHSTRVFEMGTSLLASVGKHNYQTSTAYFSLEDSSAMIQDMLHNEKLYLRWNEVGGPQTSHSPFFTQLRLKGFAEEYEKCKKEL